MEPQDEGEPELLEQEHMQAPTVSKRETSRNVRGSELKKVVSIQSMYILGMCIDLASCGKEKFTKIVEVVEKQDWEKLVGSSFTNVLIPDTLNEFCENFKLREIPICNLVVFRFPNGNLWLSNSQ